MFPLVGGFIVKSQSSKSFNTNASTWFYRLVILVSCVICSLCITAILPSFANTLDLVAEYSPSLVNWIQEEVPAVVLHKWPILLLGGSWMLAPAIHSVPSNFKTLPTTAGTVKLTSVS